MSRRSRAIQAGYRSGLEEDISDELKRKGVEFTYEKLKISWLDSKTRTYTPDFVLLDNGIIIESKGRFTSDDRRKHKEIKKQYPDLDLRFVFNNSRARLYKNAKSSYGDWCDRYGFQYANKSIPQEWIDEKGSNSND
jgi:hypothetical protein